MQRRFIGALALALVALGAAGTSVGAATSRAGAAPDGFSAPLKVLGGKFDQLAMVVDSTNAVDIAATGRGGLWFATNRGGAWSHTKILSDPTNKSWMDPSIAIDGHDRVYIALGRLSCSDCAPGGSDGIFLISDVGRARGTFPAQPTKLSGNPTGDPSIKVFKGRIYMAYDQWCSCYPGDPAKVYLKTSTNGTSWTTSVVTTHGTLPQLRIGSDGHARVAYAYLHGLGYAVAHTSTGSFTTTTVPGTTDNDYAPLLALDSSNRPQIAYQHFLPYQVRYDRQTASGWQSAETVTALRRSFGFDLDTNGAPRIAQTESVGVRVYARVGGTWTGTTVDAAHDGQMIVLRRAFNGKVDVAYARKTGGIWLTHG